MITDDGRNYRLLSCALRNDGTGWALIDDTAHRPAGITGVITHPDRLELVHDVGATAVSSVQVTPDEYLAARAYRCGASVGLASSRVYLYRGTSTTPLDPGTVIAASGNLWVTGFLTIP
ncbi:hypothetical protein [Streptomyces niveus]|uniref:hypothetical protein n=1 Tax=Streptomyces niveus TaxID=193462 RepID=UPI0036AA18CB